MGLADDDVVAGYSFHVEIDGVVLAQFKEAGGISQEISVIEHRSNKPKGIPILKKLPGHVKNADITLKRGKTSDKSLWEWQQKVIDGDIAGARANGSVVLFDYARGELARFNFTNGWPSKVALGALQAGGNDVLLEELTITHEHLEIK